jgi:hypothetical protein
MRRKAETVTRKVIFWGQKTFSVGRKSFLGGRKSFSDGWLAVLWIEMIHRGERLMGQEAAPEVPATKLRQRCAKGRR